MIDVIEIDAASHTSVDDVRTLIEEAKFVPVAGKYKIYIIDEVHMLSKSAFNALLKTIEEPPEHVKFILATTEIEKVPETIQSRAQRFDFQKISEKNITERLKFVTDSEKINAETGSLELIARLSRGGMRDALTILEQFSIDKKLELADLQNAFSILGADFYNEIITILIEKDYSSLREKLQKIESQNIKSVHFFEDMILNLRDKMRENLDSPDFEKYQTIFLLFRNAYSSTKYFPNDFALIEITLMQAVNIDNFPDIQKTSETPILEKNSI